ncbi:MAG TPA: amino acid adenylation domain-containing protein, partial [Candidatus Binatia bacterium]|nr:amino acid adenylation domain-containing protein [Candidatus Binatia bacterium]
ERSPEMLIGLLGVLKAGAAYVPVDPKAPPEWLQFVIKDTQLSLLLTVRKLLQKLPKDGPPRLCLDSPDLANESEQNPEPTATRDHLAYVIYTSGSTGTPKGTEIPHSALTNFTNYAGGFFALSSGDRVLQFASISFDTAVEEIFPCLTRGATLVVRSDDMLETVSVFMERCRDLRITVLDLPTAYWHEVVATLESQTLTIPDTLRLVIIGGEKAITERVASWQARVNRRVRLLNTYGPTETTVVATMCDLTDSSLPDDPMAEVPIGVPIGNVHVYVLDEFLKPVPVGTPGELYIGGAGVARGYLNRPELTTEKFVPNPFSSEPGSRLFRTGDLVRYRSDGNIEFLGRLDRQVKVRGFRVELDGIEAVLRKHPLVKEAVVVQEATSQKRLFAYVVLKDAAAVQVDELRSFTASKLPEYMVPSAFSVLDSLPLTTTGKIDRRALPPPDPQRADAATFVAGRTPIEIQLAGLWEEILSVKPIGIRDNFFDVGGDSLLGVRLMLQIEKLFGKSLPLGVLYEAPTVGLLSKRIAEDSKVKEWSSLVPLRPDGLKPPFFWIHGEDSDAFLPRYLGPDQPIYGLRHQGEDGWPARYTTVKQMAAHYLSEIRSVQPLGPYHLGGYCFGGLVAFEIAQILRKQGQSVSLLALLAPDRLRNLPAVDSPSNFTGNEGDCSAQPKLMAGWSTKLRRCFAGVNRRHAKQTARRLCRTIIASVVPPAMKIAKTAACRICFILGARLPITLRSFYIVDILYERAAKEYVAESYDGSVVLLRPVEDAIDTKSWQTLLDNRLEIHNVPGNHTDVLSNPDHVKSWAEVLMCYLQNGGRNAAHEFNSAQHG